jgi:hypothetical protein
MLSELDRLGELDMFGLFGDGFGDIDGSLGIELDGGGMGVVGWAPGVPGAAVVSWAKAVALIAMAAAPIRIAWIFIFISWR